MQVNALTIKNQKALKKHITRQIFPLNWQYVKSYTANWQYPINYSGGERLAKKYCTRGYAAVNHCIAHHLLLVRANGCCVHRSAEQHWSLSLGWFPLWIIDHRVQVKLCLGQNVETREKHASYPDILRQIFKAMSGRVVSQCAQCEQCDISVSILCDSPGLKDVTVKRVYTKKKPH